MKPRRKNLVRPDVIYWVGHDDGTPVGNVAQKCHTKLSTVKGILTSHRNYAARWREYRGPMNPTPDRDADSASIWVADVTWRKLEDD